MQAAGVVALAKREPALAVIVAGVVQTAQLVAAEYRVGVASLIIDLTNIHRSVGVQIPSVLDGAAGIVRHRVVLRGEHDRRRGKHRRVDSIVHERRFQRDLPAGIACG